jgi:hypothetical protein
VANYSSFQKVNGVFVPDDTSLNKFYIQHCNTENGILVGSQSQKENPVDIFVQISDEGSAYAHMVWGIKGGNLIGRLKIINSENQDVVEYYTLRQRKVIQAADTVHFIVVKDSNTEVYNVSFKGQDKDSVNGQLSEKVFTLALDRDTMCGTSDETFALVLVPKGTVNPRFITGGLKFDTLQESTDFGVSADLPEPKCSVSLWCWFLLILCILLIISVIIILIFRRRF